MKTVRAELCPEEKFSVFRATKNVTVQMCLRDRGRRIHDDGVISVSPADLALYKFNAVVHDPSDGSIAQA